MAGIRIDRRLELLRDGLIGYLMRNNSGGTVGAGSPVILDSSVQSGDSFTTTTAQDDAKVIGVLMETLANQEVGFVAFSGHIDNLKVNGTTAIVTGDHLSSYTVAAVAGKATAGKGGKFAIALEAYSVADSLGVLDAWLYVPTRDISTAATSVSDDANLVFGTTDGASTAVRVQYDKTETNDALKIGVNTASRRVFIADYGDIDTDSALAAAVNPTLTILDAVGGGADYLNLSTTTSQATLDVPTGNKIGFSVNAVDAARFSATALELVSGTNLQFLGSDKIIDANGNEIVDLPATTSATNGLKFVNATTGNPVKIGADGTGATANRGMILVDSNANEMLEMTGTASAVNHLKITNSATGSSVILGSAGVGSDANAGIDIVANGTGAIRFDNGTDPVDLRVMGAVTGFNSRVSDLSGNELIDFAGIGSATNNFGISNAANGSPPILESRGSSDANINLYLYSKGTGLVQINNDTDPVGFKLQGAAGGANNVITDVNDNELMQFQATASAVNHLLFINAATTNNPSISASGTGTDTNTGITLAPKGTGGVNIAPATTGSAGTPSLYTDGDVDTGLFTAAANVLSFTTGGTRRGGFRLAGFNVGTANTTHSTAGTLTIGVESGSAPSGAATTTSSFYASGTIMRKIIADGTDSAVG